MAGVRCFVVLSGIPFLHMKLLWEIMPGATRKFFFQTCCTADWWETGTLAHATPFLFRSSNVLSQMFGPQMCYPKCAVIPGGDIRECSGLCFQPMWRKMNERKSLVLSKRNYRGEQKNTRESSSPLCCTLPMGFCIECSKLCIQDRHRLVV